MNTPQLVTWTLKKKATFRFSQGHPWVYSNELLSSPKGLIPGSPVRLLHENGDFLAYGYGNPHSLIAFRSLSRRIKDTHFFSHEAIVEKLVAATKYRSQLGLLSQSARICFSEADALPGLIIDRYLIEEGSTTGQALAVQILTAGMEVLIADKLESILEEWNRITAQSGVNSIDWVQTAVILKKDSASRRQENLEIIEPVSLRNPLDWNLESISVQLSQDVRLKTNLLTGQKTGLFLDQRTNIDLLKSILKKADLPQTITVLDLFCYVGQWGAEVARSLQDHQTQVQLVDASQTALSFAKENLPFNNVEVITTKLDIIKSLDTIPNKTFDIVICDPPALIKSKKDFNQGQRAYYKVNREALKKVKPGGLYISCTCSHHLSDADFISTLNKAAQSTPLKWIAKGSQAMDHPLLPNFPEGSYLKAIIGKVEDNPI